MSSSLDFPFPRPDLPLQSPVISREDEPEGPTAQTPMILHRGFTLYAENPSDLRWQWLEQKGN